MTVSLSSVLAEMAALPPAAYAGALGVAFNCIWPLLRTRRQILWMQVASSLMFGLHYVLLGAGTAAAMCAAGALQGVAASSIARPLLRNGVFGATIVASLAVTALTWSGLPSLFAQSGQLASAFGRLQRGQQAIRLAFLGSEAFWIGHNLMVGSTWGLISDAMAVTTLLVGLWRGMPARQRVALAPAVAAS